MLALNKNDPARRQLINKMRKEGDFCSGSILPVQGRNDGESDDASKHDLLPCVHCKGLSLKIFNRSNY